MLLLLWGVALSQGPVSAMPVLVFLLLALEDRVTGTTAQTSR
jgi:hypothetical protein